MYILVYNMLLIVGKFHFVNFGVYSWNKVGMLTGQKIFQKLQKVSKMSNFHVKYFLGTLETLIYIKFLKSELRDATPKI